jgi:hypothetical protein
VIASVKTRPFSPSILVVYFLTPASHVGLAAMQILASAPLTEVEGILHEEAMAIGGAMTGVASATCTHSLPSISSVRTPESEKHASMTTVFKHLKSHHAPWSSKVPPCFTVAPTV